MIDILDKSYEPTFSEITDSMKDNSKKRWKLLTVYIEENFNTKPSISYSKCSGRPGWNVKYKKSGRALCTLYPGDQFITALIVLNNNDMEWFKGMRRDFSEYVLNLYDNCALFNGTKWMMIDIISDKILNDIKNLMSLKLQ